MDEASIARAVETAVGLGPLRAAVVVHGGPPPPDAGGRVVNREGKRLSMAHFRHSVDVFLNSAFCVTSYAAEAMAKNEPDADGQRGVIINTASIAGFEGQPGLVPYSAAKGGIIGMTLTLARDMGPIGIRAVAIAPGTFLTLAYGNMTDEAKQKFAQSIPNPKRMGDPEEYASLAAHVVENNFLNGTTIRLDGGQRFS
jgi:NAD(P)-dependent dehydrogenase (short-subunit alcohol dehydrogenase family)